MSDESTPAISEYNGKPMLVLNPGAQYPFQFGLSKARLILKDDNIEYIKRFVESNGTSLDE